MRFGTAVSMRERARILWLRVLDGADSRPVGVLDRRQIFRITAVIAALIALAATVATASHPSPAPSSTLALDPAGVAPPSATAEAVPAATAASSQAAVPVRHTAARRRKTQTHKIASVTAGAAQPAASASRPVTGASRSAPVHNAASPATHPVISDVHAPATPPAPVRQSASHAAPQTVVVPTASSDAAALTIGPAPCHPATKCWLGTVTSSGAGLAAVAPAITANTFHSLVLGMPESVLDGHRTALDASQMTKLFGPSLVESLSRLQPAGAACRYYLDAANRTAGAYEVCFRSGALISKESLSAPTGSVVEALSTTSNAEIRRP